MVSGYYETFKFRGQSWTRYPAEADAAYVMGLDLGQSTDPTALVVMHHTRTPLDSWSVDKDKCITRQDMDERFDVTWAERVPLGTSYPAIVDHVREVLSRPPLRQAGCHLVIDESGVGRAVGDMFEQAGLRAIRCAITSGSDAVQIDHGLRWHVAKSLLISGVDARLHAGELRFAAELREAPALREELKEFQRHVTAAGRATYAPRVGKHDDLTLACALCVWWCVERQRHCGAYTGGLTGLY